MRKTLRQRRTEAGKPLDAETLKQLDANTEKSRDAMEALQREAGLWLDERQKLLDSISDTSLRDSAAR